MPLTKGLTCDSDSLAWRNLDGVFAEEGYQLNVGLKPLYAIEEKTEYEEIANALKKKIVALLKFLW